MTALERGDAPAAAIPPSEIEAAARADAAQAAAHTEATTREVYSQGERVGGRYRAVLWSRGEPGAGTVTGPAVRRTTVWETHTHLNNPGVTRTGDWPSADSTGRLSGRSFFYSFIGTVEGNNFYVLTYDRARDITYDPVRLGPLR